MVIHNPGEEEHQLFALVGGEWGEQLVLDPSYYAIELAEPAPSRRGEGDDVPPLVGQVGRSLHQTR